MKVTKTNRGFATIKFKDYNEQDCSLQKSSLATDDCVWLGNDNLNRMHLTKAQVKKLLPHLQKFVESGDI